MADITMCSNTQCPLKANCLRSISKPSTWQSYSMYNYRFTAKGVECDFHLPGYDVVVATSTDTEGATCQQEKR
jgi:hypothetical protein